MLPADSPDIPIPRTPPALRARAISAAVLRELRDASGPRLWRAVARRRHHDADGGDGVLHREKREHSVDRSNSAHAQDLPYSKRERAEPDFQDDCATVRDRTELWTSRKAAGLRWVGDNEIARPNGAAVSRFWSS